MSELAEIEDLQGRLARLADDVVLLETEDSDLGREQSKIDADVDQVRTRMQRDQQRLDAGQVGSPRELENLQHEIESLHRRQSELEDVELEVMEKRELVQNRLDEMRREREQMALTLSETRAAPRHDMGGDRRRGGQDDHPARRAGGNIAQRVARPLREGPRVVGRRRCCGVASRRSARVATCSSTRPTSTGSATPTRTRCCAAKSAGAFSSAPLTQACDALRVVVEADGGSRGNPGPAGYGAVVRDADTGQVLREVAAGIGVASNNVAEYRGLIAGLEAARDLGADAVDVRMDSLLVVNQMSGLWKVKHEAMKPLALTSGGSCASVHERQLPAHPARAELVCRPARQRGHGRCGARPDVERAHRGPGA